MGLHNSYNPNSDPFSYQGMTPNERRAQKLLVMLEHYGDDLPFASSDYEYMNEAVQHAIHLLQQEELNNE